LDVESSDIWVLSRVVGSANIWQFDGTWDSRDLEVKDPDGRWHRRRIQKLWASEGKEYISLDRPWRNSLDTKMEYRIYTSRYPLPSDAIDTKTFRLWDYTMRSPMEVMLLSQAESHNMDDVRGLPTASGIPIKAFRQPFDMLRPPAMPPVATFLARSDDGQGGWNDDWQDEQPTGLFDYKITYQWGRQDPQEFQTPTNRSVPRWESAPSSVSAQVDVLSQQGVVQLTLPRPNWMMHYDGHDANTTTGSAQNMLRETHGGYRVRIYRRRLSSSDPTISSPNAWYFLDVVEGDVTTFIDNGIRHADRTNRTKDRHAYDTVQFYPRPSDQYMVDIRYASAPEALSDDSDVPTIPPEASSLIVHRSLELFYESIGEAPLAERARRLYENNLTTYHKRYGLLPSGVLHKRPSRVRRR